MLLPILLMIGAAPATPGKCEYDASGSSWFQDADYPPSALARREQGPVTYRLQVDAEGCVTACELVESSGIPALDAVTCPVLMRRAHFTAARDAAGKSVASSFVGTQWWVIPEPFPPGLTPAKPRSMPVTWFTNDDYPAAALRAEQQGNVGFRVTVDATGRVTDCTVWLSSGSALLDATTCSLMRRRGRFNPGRDASGQAVPSAWVSGLRWRVPEGS